MAETFVRQVVDVRVDPVVIFRELIGVHDGGFWIDDSLGDTVSYLGVGVPVTAADPFAEFDRADGFPVSRIGWVGYGERAVTMDMSVAREPQPRTGMLAVSLAIEINHRDNSMSIIGIERDQSFDELLAAVSALTVVTAPATAAPPARIAVWRDDPRAYATFIESCLGHIRDGDAYQLCLTTGVHVSGAIDVVDTYCALRAIAPTRHAAFLRIGHIALLSASPETFLTVRGRLASTSPIKGTRRRSSDSAEDRRLKSELETSEKERAENLMIVDLCRNDLSRVCEPGSVTVTSLNRIETYSTVHQLVSTVTGELRAGCSAGDAARALFPAGSMTGAPKQSAVDILNRLETAERGVYAGAFGFSGAGNLSLAMTIRTIVVDREGAHIGVGGGITSGSRADEEIAEVGVKAAALLSVLGASPNPYLGTE
ncbi:MAG: anthranilate synthase component I family protein [Microbacteriaceae bacterium]|nr:anthranilate synthase component I family protein [Microbacteriaceae bacterium]